eukprot:UN31541
MKRMYQVQKYFSRLVDRLFQTNDFFLLFEQIVEIHQMLFRLDNFCDYSTNLFPILPVRYLNSLYWKVAIFHYICPKIIFLANPSSFSQTRTMVFCRKISVFTAGI